MKNPVVLLSVVGTITATGTELPNGQSADGTTCEVASRPNGNTGGGFHPVMRLGLWNAQRARASAAHTRMETVAQPVAEPHAN